MKEPKTEDQQEDQTLLIQLTVKLNSRAQKPLVKQCCHTTVYRDRVNVAWRYLRRFAGGQWHRGGSHCARLNMGPGVGFRGLRNDRSGGFQAFPINFSTGGVQ